MKSQKMKEAAASKAETAEERWEREFRQKCDEERQEQEDFMRDEIARLQELLAEKKKAAQ